MEPVDKILRGVLRKFRFPKKTASVTMGQPDDFIVEPYMRALGAFLMLAAMSACGQVNYDAAPVGRFDGSVVVMWVGETQDGLGDGNFVFVPTQDPLTFTRNNPRATVQQIRPQIMYTDGGSVPQLAQVFNGFSPWGYAPAYMIHDWLFTARKCLNDDAATPAEEAVRAMTFADSAEVAAEAIKTLIEAGDVLPNDLAPRTISSAVAGPISRAKWNEKGACAAERVKDEHLAQIENALPGTLGPARRMLTVRRGDQPKARIIQVIEF